MNINELGLIPTGVYKCKNCQSYYLSKCPDDTDLKHICSSRNWVFVPLEFGETVVMFDTFFRLKPGKEDRADAYFVISEGNVEDFELIVDLADMVQIRCQDVRDYHGDDVVCIRMGYTGTGHSGLNKSNRATWYRRKYAQPDLDTILRRLQVDRDVKARDLDKIDKEIESVKAAIVAQVRLRDQVVDRRT